MSDARPPLPVLDAAIDLERDGFLRNLIGELAETLEEVIGLEEAEGYVALVGQRVGDALGERYRQALAVDRIPEARLPDVLVDLKRRIRGGFSVESADARGFTLVNDACPFAERVHGRASLCMMTSNVFGTICADDAGHARVVLHETIARGDGRCVVQVLLGEAAGDPSPGGREYWRVDD